jgi:tellurite resistance protein TehA-like permease
MAIRATLHPTHFRRSLTNPTEAFFISAFLLSICILLCCTQLYGLTHGPCGPWLTTTLRILYWIYAALSLCHTTFQFNLFMHNARTHKPIPFSPSWFLTGYAAMLTGTVASIIAGSQPAGSRVPILVSGVMYQGFGFALSMLLIGVYVMQLMEKGYPPPPVRPGMFIPVGTPAYTIIAFIGLARAIPEDYGYFATHPSAAGTLQTLALIVGIALWVFTFWLCAVAVVGCVFAFRTHGKMKFALPWWAFVFPNVGFTVATIDLGREMGSEGVLWVGSAMTVALVIVWLGTVGMCVRAVVKGEIVWPGKDEDKDV